MRLSADARPFLGACYRMTGLSASVWLLPQSALARNPAARVGARGHRSMSLRFSSLLLALVLGAGQGFAQDRVPLPEEAHINEQLIAASAGDILRNTCPTISARFFVVWQKLRDLEEYARDKGYGEAEVTAFLKDKTQRKRVKVAAEAYLAAAGVIEGDAESYCVVGRAEIAKGTLVGSLLRSWE